MKDEISVSEVRFLDIIIFIDLIFTVEKDDSGYHVHFLYTHTHTPIALGKRKTK